MGKTRYQPILNTLELLLQGHPEEFLDIRAGQPESDRAAMTHAATTWLGRSVLQPDERDRIRAVWIDGEYRSPLNVNRERREELRALVVPRRRADRMDSEQLQAAMGGEA